MEKYCKRIPNPKQLDAQKERGILKKAVVNGLRLFLRQGWAYEGIESVEDIWGNKIDTADEFGMISSDRRMFLDVSDCLAQAKSGVDRELIKDDSGNNRKLTSQRVQREIVRICAKETINSILSEIGDSNFSLILDSSRGMAWHEYVSLVVLFVSKTGAVIERFLGTIDVPVDDFTAVSLKGVVEEYLKEAGLKLEKLRCYSYNASSYLCEILSDLRGVPLEEQKLANHVHCFSYPFQLTIVTVGKYNCEVYWLFKFLDGLRDFLKHMPIKLKDPLKQEELAEIMKSVNTIGAVFTSDELVYHEAIVGFIAHYSSVLDLVEFTYDFGSCRDQKFKSHELLRSVNFAFAVSLFVMRDITSLTHELSQLLQMRENEIEKAVSLVGVVNQKLRDLRDHGWDPLFSEVSAFCEKNEIEVL